MPRTKVNDRIYKGVKMMVKGGATNKEAADFFMLSTWTVSAINNSESYEDYRQNMAVKSIEAKKRNENPKKPEKKEEKKDDEFKLTDDCLPGGRLSANYQMNRLIELVATQNEILTLISNKLAFIVEQLS